MEINNENNFTTKLLSISKNLINKNSLNNSQNNIDSYKLTQEDLNTFTLSNEENIKLILSTIGVSFSEKNMSLVNLLLNSSITVNKENLTNASLNLKLFNEFPLEKLEVLLKNNIEPNTENAIQLEKYIYENINLNSEIENLFSNIKNTEILSNILNCFTNKKEILDLNKEIFLQLNNIKSEIINNLKNNSSNLDNVLKCVKYILTENPNLIKQSPILKDIYQNFNNSNKLQNINNNILSEIPQNEVNNILKDIVNNILPSKILFNKDNINYLSKALKQTFSNDLIKNNNNLDLEKIILKNIFKDFNIKEFKDFIPKVLNFQNKLNKEICFDFINSNSKDLNIFLNNLKQKIELTKDIINKNNILESDTIKQNIDNIDKNFDFLSQLKHTSLIQIPLNINENKTNADLFIFKDKKNNNKNKNSNNGSALLSLNLTNLGLIETYINKINNDIYCQFRIKNQNTAKFIKNNLNLLIYYLKEKNLNLKEVNFKHIDEKFSIISKEPNKNLDKIDFKSFNAQA